MLRSLIQEIQMSYSLENHLIWSQVMKNLSIPYTSTLAYKLRHTFIGHYFTLRIIGCCALLTRDAPALLFLAVWEPDDKLELVQHCIVVLKHSGTAA